MMINSIPLQTITKQPDGSWLFTWNSTDASSYRVVLWGVELAVVVGTSYSVALAAYSQYPPPIEVVPAGVLALTEQNKCFLIIQWYGVVCDYYLLEEYTGGAWVTKAVVAERGSYVYTATSPLLADGADADYRVTAVDSIGQKSNPLEFRMHVVRPPDEVRPSINYDNSGQNIVIG